MANTLSGIVKQVQECSETAVFEFNGIVYICSFERFLSDACTTVIVIREYGNMTEIARHSWPGGMGCAIVDAGVVHIFGSTSWASDWNTVIHSTLDPVSFAPSTPTVVLTCNASFKIYNTDVCAYPGGYRMVVETTVGVYFAKSTSLSSAFTYHGGQLNAGAYCGCPTIDYFGGAFYLTFLADAGGGVLVTVPVKSIDDCFTFDIKGLALIAPDANGEGISASDLDYIEHNGETLMIYLVGDQSSSCFSKTAKYPGTVAQMFGCFFP